MENQRKQAALQDRQVADARKTDAAASKAVASADESRRNLPPAAVYEISRRYE